MTSPKPPVQIKIRGHLFPSISAAASFFGVIPGTIQAALDKGTLDRVGLRHAPGSTKKIPVLYLGVAYPSIAALSRASGIPTSTLQERLRRGDPELKPANKGTHHS